MSDIAPCVVFDLDDTLYLERDYVRSGLQAVGRSVRETCAIEGFATVAWEAFERGVRGRLFDEAFASLGLDPPPGLIADLVTVYRGHEPDLCLLPDSAAALATLRGTASVIAVVSDGPAVSQRAKAAALGAGEWASLIVITEELGLGKGKPHPMAFEMVEETLGFRGRDCLYIADNPGKDFSAPAQLGWQTARIRRSGSLHETVISSSDVEREAVDLWWISGAGASAAATCSQRGARPEEPEARA